MVIKQAMQENGNRAVGHAKKNWRIEKCEQEKRSKENGKQTKKRSENINKKCETLLKVQIVFYIRFTVSVATNHKCIPQWIKLVATIVHNTHQILVNLLGSQLVSIIQVGILCSVCACNSIRA